MVIEMLYSKIHRATVTDANLHYVGSITIDQKLMEEAGLLEGQKVDIVNINNGERFSTYVITGEPGSGEICLNGAAARKVAIGDKIIIIAYALMEIEEAKNYKPRVILVDEKNRVVATGENLKKE
ncbi:MAG: aspartate 1-decarboxylase [Epsilonproteobacteria bacterium]|jgi:aspartate 1-decarboxylase|nr:aspartate 1-decarboxylase [Campylobacterota bacterium]NPA88986.1 aspartate 1-decarboxylase [Campylobacterota bacterium]